MLSGWQLWLRASINTIQHRDGNVLSLTAHDFSVYSLIHAYVATLTVVVLAVGLCDT